MHISWRKVKKAADAVFARQPEIYSGLYHGIEQAAAGKAKKPEKTLREFYQRTGYNVKDPTLHAALSPAFEREQAPSPRLVKKLARVLLRRARRAGLVSDKDGEQITLTDQTLPAYSEWNGDELYAQDTAEIIKGAWYQNGKVIETGFCRVILPDTK